MKPPRTLAITPAAPGPWIDRLATLPAQGVDGVLVRLIAAPAALPEVLRAIPAGLTVLVRPTSESDAETAIRRELGLHLPSQMVPAQWRARQPGLLSAACHSASALKRAAAAGADMALLSPVFSPGSKPDDDRPTLGIDGFLSASRAVAIPVLALGGITAARAARLRSAGAYGVAGISAYFGESTR